MTKVYTFRKREFSKNNVESINIYFRNGDYLPIKKNEIRAASVTLSDKLCNDNRNYCFTACKGEIDCRILFSKKAKAYEVSLQMPKEYIKSRKSYIEKRCTKENEIEHIKVYDENGWNFSLFGDIKAHVENDHLFICFNSPEECSRDFAQIELDDVQREKLNGITLDFENCESYKIYNSEIIDMCLSFKTELTWAGNDISRDIDSGFIIFRLDKRYTDREGYLFETKINDISSLYKRLCGRWRRQDHDICHLYLDYVGSTADCEERICVDEIRSEEELSRVFDAYDEDESLVIKGPCYVGGYAKRLKGGRMAVTFGKDAEKLLKNLK